MAHQEIIKQCKRIAAAVCRQVHHKVHTLSCSRLFAPWLSTAPRVSGYACPQGRVGQPLGHGPSGTRSPTISWSEGPTNRLMGLSFVLGREEGGAVWIEEDGQWWYLADPAPWTETQDVAEACVFRAQACACDEAYFIIEPALPGWVWTRYQPFGCD